MDTQALLAEIQRMQDQLFESIEKLHRKATTGTQRSIQPAVKPGMVVDVLIDGSGPHYGVVQKVADFGLLVLIDEDDASHGGKSVVVEMESTRIIPAQNLIDDDLPAPAMHAVTG